MTKAENKSVKKAGTPREAGRWIKHVQAFRQEHQVTFKVALRTAGATYTKVVKEKRDKADHKPNPWMVHIASWKATNPDWKTTMSYKEVLKVCKLTYSPGSKSSTQPIETDVEDLTV